MAQKSADEHELSRSDFKTYNYTSTSFIKREIPLGERQKGPDGQPIDNPLLESLFLNEAVAYQLLWEKTKILVPKLLSCGRDGHGQLYLETELVRGAAQASEAAKFCSRPSPHGISMTSNRCPSCDTTVSANVQQFVNDIVLPELKTLKSRRTGLNGCVIPPRWVLRLYPDNVWKEKISSSNEYVFVLHDLVDHNILVSLDTLEVVALVDLEESGYFPSEMQGWRFNRAGQFDIYEEKGLVASHVDLLK